MPLYICTVQDGASQTEHHLWLSKQTGQPNKSTGAAEKPVVSAVTAGGCE